VQAQVVAMAVQAEVVAMAVQGLARRSTSWGKGLRFVMLLTFIYFTHVFFLTGDVKHENHRAAIPMSLIAVGDTRYPIRPGRSPLTHHDQGSCLHSQYTKT
jgi:hypothetical protein